MSMTAEQYNKALAYNSKQPLIAHYLGDGATPHDVAKLQAKMKIEEDGMFGPSTLAAARMDYMLSHDVMLKPDYAKIAAFVSKFEGNYWSMNLDGEFKGAFDKNGKKHWASGKYHIGLSFGYIQFTQDGGALGQLLALMKKTNPFKFAEIFGRDGDELVRITNLPKGETSNGRSRRVQKIGGYDLWESPWKERFAKAGRDEEFQRCQRELAISNYMMPALATCRELGIRSERGLAFAFDRSVQFGTTGAKNSFKMHFIKDLNEFKVMQSYVNKFKNERWCHRSAKILETKELSDRAVW